ncbi:ChrR family anti-sigma-E factor [Pararhodobacter oceanensis]|uniref:ChrR family anti-sigma-E factor n=1 Tax=Pararhodobacter oceanensis TaxID=2172121 RepID=UPI003A8E95D4
MIRHHLTDALLIAYAAGDLAEAYSLAVATHISLCDECRARLAAYEALGGAVLEGCDTAPVSDGSLAETMARIRNGAPAERAVPVSRGVFPTPLQAYIGGDAEAVRWRSIGGGVKQAILGTSKAASARLLRIPGGTAVPDHSHGGLELTLVLQGAFSDEGGRFARGDIEIADQSVEHTPTAEAGPDCICLAVTDAPLRFNSLIPRLLQPFVKI